MQVAGASTPTFSSTLRSEWTKLFSTRAPKRNLFLGVFLGIALSTVLSVTIRATFNGWPQDEKELFDPILYPLSGTLLVAIFFVVFAVNAVSPEYSSGMIRQTFTVTPKRGRVIAAKALIVFACLAVAGGVSTIAMEAISQLVLRPLDVPAPDWGSWDLWRTVLATTLVGPLMPVLAVLVGFLLRSAAGTISAMLALMFAPGIIGALLPRWVQENILAYLPSNASDSLVTAHLQDSEQYLSAPAAIAVAIAWAIGMFLLTKWVVDRRDVQ